MLVCRNVRGVSFRKMELLLISLQAVGHRNYKMRAYKFTKICKNIETHENSEIQVICNDLEFQKQFEEIFL